MAISERLEAAGREPPQELTDRPRLDLDQQYMASQFMILHRTRSQGFSGLMPISLEAIGAFMDIWPQYDVLRFVEITLAIDQGLINLLAEDSKAKEENTHVK